MKIRILVLMMAFFVFMSCGQKKLDDALAAEVIKEAFELSEEDSFEILGISEESEGVSIVKFKLNEVQISSKMRKYDKGWQLDEIQNDFGMWVPAENLTRSFSDAEKQKNAMTDIMTIATGLADYVVDNSLAPKQTGSYDKNSEFYQAISPFYIKELPIKDPWGNNYQVYCGLECSKNYGLLETDLRNDDFLVFSFGSDGMQDSWMYESTNPTSGMFIVSSPDDFANDLVNWSGSWIRAPRSAIQ